MNTIQKLIIMIFALLTAGCLSEQIEGKVYAIRDNGEVTPAASIDIFLLPASDISIFNNELATHVAKQATIKHCDDLDSMKPVYENFFDEFKKHGINCDITDVNYKPKISEMSVELDEIVDIRLELGRKIRRLERYNKSSEAQQYREKDSALKKNAHKIVRARSELMDKEYWKEQCHYKFIAVRLIEESNCSAISNFNWLYNNLNRLSTLNTVVSLETGYGATPVHRFDTPSPQQIINEQNCFLAAKAEKIAVAKTVTDSEGKFIFPDVERENVALFALYRTKYFSILWAINADPNTPKIELNNRNGQVYNF